MTRQEIIEEYKELVYKGLACQRNLDEMSTDDISAEIASVYDGLEWSCGDESYDDGAYDKLDPSL